VPVSGVRASYPAKDREGAATACAILLHMAINAAPQEKDTKLVRISLPEGSWRRLRLAAADQGVSLTKLVGAILEVEAARVSIRAMEGDGKTHKPGRA